MGTLYPKKERKKVSSLWWLIAFSIIITTSIYIALNDKAEIDIIVEKQRLTALLFGFLISGICGTCIFMNK